MAEALGVALFLAVAYAIGVARERDNLRQALESAATTITDLRSALGQIADLKKELEQTRIRADELANQLDKAWAENARLEGASDSP